MNNSTHYTGLFSRRLPGVVLALIHTPDFMRLAGIGMHCGCDYTRFPLYQNVRGFYSRYTHSIGVARIVWNFTADQRQAVAGLLHDIATPVFAHTVDFMNKDHLNQESTEDKTRAVIADSPEICSILRRYGLSVDAVCDYHRYPIADNDSPRLSADRLEYTLGNAYMVYQSKARSISAIYRDLYVARNENGEEELAFHTLEQARAFTRISLKNAYWFVSDEDRFAMQYLSDLLRDALAAGVLAQADLMTTECEVIHKLSMHNAHGCRWLDYAQIGSVSAAQDRPKNCYSVNIPAKKRYIDPLVQAGAGSKRISELDEEADRQIQAFLRLDFNRWLFKT